MNEDSNEPETNRFDNRIIPTFLQKTYALVENPEFKDIVDWGPDFNSFVIHDPNRFAREVLPQYFKQNKMSSFVRQVQTPFTQLNMYDFHKKTSTDGKEHIFIHPLFLRGNQQALARIKRKKNGKKSSKCSLSTDSSLTTKQRRVKFLEEYRMTKQYVAALEKHIKDLVHEYTYLLDQCRELALDLNSVKKELSKRIEMITVMIFNIITNSNTNTNQGTSIGNEGKPGLNSAPERDRINMNKEVSNTEDRSQAYKLADNSEQAKEVINSLNGLKNLLFRTENASDAIKNLKSHVFMNPNAAISGERKALPPQSPSYVSETPIDKLVGPNFLNLAHQDSSRTGGGFSQLPCQTPRSGDDISNLIDLSRSQSVKDTLGKRQPLSSDTMDSELRYRDPLYGSKRLVSDNGIENVLHSPQVQNSYTKFGSGSHSPVNSYTGGFKLHSSRKNSGIEDVIGELRASPKVVAQTSPSYNHQ